MQEDDAVGLLKAMARDKVMVEICLTSNDEGLSLAICIGAHAVTPVRSGGLEFIPLKRLSLAWRIV